MTWTSSSSEFSVGHRNNFLIYTAYLHEWVGVFMALIIILDNICHIFLGRTPVEDVDPSLLFPFVPRIIKLFNKDYKLRKKVPGKVDVIYALYFKTYPKVHCR